MTEFRVRIDESRSLYAFREHGGKKGDVLEFVVHTKTDGLVQSGDEVKLTLSLGDKKEVRKMQPKSAFIQSRRPNEYTGSMLISRRFM